MSKFLDALEAVATFVGQTLAKVFWYLFWLVAGVVQTGGFIAFVVASHLVVGFVFAGLGNWIFGWELTTAKAAVLWALLISFFSGGVNVAFFIATLYAIWANVSDSLRRGL